MQTLLLASDWCVSTHSGVAAHTEEEHERPAIWAGPSTAFGSTPCLRSPSDLGARGRSFLILNDVDGDGEVDLYISRFIAGSSGESILQWGNQ
jgi:hypothetical protein